MKYLFWRVSSDCTADLRRKRQILLLLPFVIFWNLFQHFAHVINFVISDGTIFPFFLQMYLICEYIRNGLAGSALSKICINYVCEHYQLGRLHTARPPDNSMRISHQWRHANRPAKRYLGHIDFPLRGVWWQIARVDWKLRKSVLRLIDQRSSAVPR